MPIETSALQSAHLITLKEWRVQDSDLLAEIVMHVVTGRVSHALKVLGHDAGTAPRYSEQVIHLAIGKLNMAGKNRDDAGRIHRDGWLFQMISWAVSLREFPGRLVQVPHAQPADKGFDGLLLEISEGAVASTMICEDKATDDPRGTVNVDVWDDFRKVEAGLKDDRLTSSAETLLGRAGIEPSGITASSTWFTEKQYRASVATSRAKIPPVVEVFAGYDAAVPGEGRARLANLMVHDDLRGYMDEIAELVIQKLRAMKEQVDV